MKNSQNVTPFFGYTFKNSLKKSYGLSQNLLRDSGHSGLLGMLGTQALSKELKKKKPRIGIKGVQVYVYLLKMTTKCEWIQIEV
jgi:hypothetical protein